jgi:hypothetical protein
MKSDSKKKTFDDIHNDLQRIRERCFELGIKFSYEISVPGQVLDLNGDPPSSVGSGSGSPAPQAPPQAPPTVDAPLGSHPVVFRDPPPSGYIQTSGPMDGPIMPGDDLQLGQEKKAFGTPTPSDYGLGVPPGLRTKYDNGEIIKKDPGHNPNKPKFIPLETGLFKIEEGGHLGEGCPYCFVELIKGEDGTYPVKCPHCGRCIGCD